MTIIEEISHDFDYLTVNYSVLTLWKSRLPDSQKGKNLEI